MQSFRFLLGSVLIHVLTNGVIKDGANPFDFTSRVLPAPLFLLTVLPCHCASSEF
jgi:hypothetical protein